MNRRQEERESNIVEIYQDLVVALVRAGEASNYRVDANEPDPRYQSYGVRAPELRAIWRSHKPQVLELPYDNRLDLATLLIKSGFGEQQSLGAMVLESMPGFFTADNLHIIDGFVQCLRGWSKVDTFAVGILRTLLLTFPDEMISLCRNWNVDPDPWPRRASVVIFTRTVAATGRFTGIALELCDSLVNDPHLHVRKGAGWALKDLMRSDQGRVLDYVCRLRAAGASNDVVLYAIKELDPELRRDILLTRPSG